MKNILKIIIKGQAGNKLAFRTDIDPAIRFGIAWYQITMLRQRTSVILLYFGPFTISIAHK